MHSKYRPPKGRTRVLSLHVLRILTLHLERVQIPHEILQLALLAARLLGHCSSSLVTSSFLGHDPLLISALSVSLSALTAGRLSNRPTAPKHGSDVWKLTARAAAATLNGNDLCVCAWCVFVCVCGAIARLLEATLAGCTQPDKRETPPTLGQRV